MCYTPLLVSQHAAQLSDALSGSVDSISLSLVHQQHHTHLRTQPLVTVSPQLLDSIAFAELRAWISETPLARRRNALADSFNTTSGVVLLFTRAGIPVLRDCELFAPMYAFLQAVLLPQATAFALNILSSSPASLEEAADANQAAAGSHTDNTLLANLRPESGEVDGESHQTNVIYVVVPLDMANGALELWAPDLSTDRQSGGGIPVLGPMPAVLLAPMENTGVAFRGDAEHRVRKHSSASGSVRISLVVEQYILSEPLLSSLRPFWVDGEEDAERAEDNQVLAPYRHLWAPREGTRAVLPTNSE